jgi:hypothetical protein
MSVMEADNLCAAEGSKLASIQGVNDSRLAGNFISQNAGLSQIFVGNNMR